MPPSANDYMHDPKVVVEKPIGLNAREAKEVVQAAKAARRLLLEANWTHFFPSVKKLARYNGQAKI